jgi:hypothetical protein
MRAISRATLLRRGPGAPQSPTTKNLSSAGASGGVSAAAGPSSSSVRFMCRKKAEPSTTEAIAIAEYSRVRWRPGPAVQQRLFGGTQTWSLFDACPNFSLNYSLNVGPPQLPSPQLPPPPSPVHGRHHLRLHLSRLCTLTFLAPWLHSGPSSWNTCPWSMFPLQLSKKKRSVSSLSALSASVLSSWTRAARCGCCRRRSPAESNK